MLLELRIKNLAIIDELDLTFSRGLNILTGETGAGKSIILNAVYLLLGDKAPEEVIRGSENEASVEALFDLSGNRRLRERIREKDPKLQDPEEKDTLLVQRTITRSGRGRVFVNGHLATLGMLSEIGGEVLSIYGQHEHQTLQQVETHLDILDEFGGLLPLRGTFQGQFEAITRLSEEIRRIREEKERRSRERELMAFQAREIEASGIQVGEEEALKEERRVLAHARKLMEFAESAGGALYGDEESATGKIQAILRQGRDMASVDPSLSSLLESLDSARIQLEEASLMLREYSRRIEMNPERLEEIENRLEVIDQLKRKYGPTVEAILLLRSRLDEQLTSWTTDEERLTTLESGLVPLQKEVEALAQRLSQERRRTAEELKKATEKELGSLGMKKTTFDVQIGVLPLSSKGVDRVEFLISPNVGEAVKPLAKIASGGELSRIMLAMKRILARVGGRQVLIFDEVDSGIGGATAEVVGRKLRELSRHHQVICVTHLPQIASFADEHHSVGKEVRSGRTVTIVQRLEEDGRVDEIARMLGGVKVTDRTRAHAREMLEHAQKT